MRAGDKASAIGDPAVRNRSGDRARRLKPKVWDSDFTLMRCLATAYRSVIARHVGSSGDLTVVDYGCGPMPYRALLESATRKYIGADFPGNVEADVFVGDDGSLPLADASADVVVSSQVLEHVLDVDGYLRESRRVLRDDGILLLSTHGTWIYHPHPTDVRRWTRWGLKFDIEKSGFRVIETIACMGPLAYTGQVRLLLWVGLLNRLGAVGKIARVPLCLLYQGLMWLEDRITPAWVTAENAAVYVVAARKAAAGGANS